MSGVLRILRHGGDPRPALGIDAQRARGLCPHRRVGVLQVRPDHADVIDGPILVQEVDRLAQGHRNIRPRAQALGEPVDGDAIVAGHQHAVRLQAHPGPRVVEESAERGLEALLGRGWRAERDALSQVEHEIGVERLVAVGRILQDLQRRVEERLRRTCGASTPPIESRCSASCPVRRRAGRPASCRPGIPSSRSRPAAPRPAATGREASRSRVACPAAAPRRWPAAASARRPEGPSPPRSGWPGPRLAKDVACGNSLSGACRWTARYQ